uniref:NADH-ubiquinone oxidoreductase chain 5 n=1 Tax=Tylosurus melanotus TaxID=3053213 RepID=A0A167NFD7_9TELE|nr:NADH dehydrogenase subunit 5 [Tylosurus acus melanotus]
MHISPLIMASTYKVIFLILNVPILSTIMPMLFKHNQVTLHFKTAVKETFFLTMIPLYVYFMSGTEIFLLKWTWTNTHLFDINISIQVDLYSILFNAFALYVTCPLLEFASWYIPTVPYKEGFSKSKQALLKAMIIIETANNFQQLFIGWDAVGIICISLNSWWYARAEPNTAALQAVLYNRVGDIGHLVAMASLASNLNSSVLQHTVGSSLNWYLTLPLNRVMLAAAVQWAQFGLHPWLPSAMEGPTPVSALLQCSTMVVVGILSHFAVSPHTGQEPWPCTNSVCLGALTTMLSASCAVTQIDIKKMSAFSMSSHLGVMMVTIGVNHPQLALLHIWTHALKKAMLFLCSGSIIHNLNDVQDIRKMRGMHHMGLMTSSCLTIGTHPQKGTPIVAGFFSKDAINEAVNTSYQIAWALPISHEATSFTATESLRFVILLTMGIPRFKRHAPIIENNPSFTNPIKRLASGSMLPRVLMTPIFFAMKTPVMTMPAFMKMAAVNVWLIGLLSALDLASMTTKQLKTMRYSSTHHFSKTVGLWPQITQPLAAKLSLFSGQCIASQTLNQTCLEKSGRKAISCVNTPFGTSATIIQPAKIKTYLSLFLLSLSWGLIVMLF